MPSNTPKIVIDGEIQNNDYTHIDLDNDTLPSTGNIIVDYQQWLDNQAAFDAHEGLVGIKLNGNDYDIYAIGAQVSQTHSLIALDFPDFVDGRCYSFATLLRQRFGFKGELRAVGNVLLDQLSYMNECGINAFEVEPDKLSERALKHLNDFSVHYVHSA